MSEERITTVEANDSNAAAPAATTHTTIIRDADDHGASGGAGWLIALVLVIALAAGIYIFSQTSASEVVKDNAIANAANEVGSAAGAVGEAAGQVGDAVEDAADNIAR